MLSTSYYSNTNKLNSLCNNIYLRPRTKIRLIVKGMNSIIRKRKTSTRSIVRRLNLKERWVVHKKIVWMHVCMHVGTG